MNEIQTFKGFNKDLTCKDFQYELGKEFEMDGTIKACERGFHACEVPLDVFRYYSPASSRYCKVEQSGEFSRDSYDSKVASSKIKIGAEIGIPGLIKAHIEYVKAHTNMEHTDPKQATAGSYGAATAGDSGAATSRGSVAVGENGVGTVRGEGVKIKGSIGAILVCAVEEDGSFNIKTWAAAVVDGKKIKADTWYTVVNGEFIEVEE